MGDSGRKIQQSEGKKAHIMSFHFKSNHVRGSRRKGRPMYDQSLHVLEFDKIKSLLGKYTHSSLGQEKVKKLSPSVDFDEVVKWQEETDEAVKVLRHKENAPLEGIYDIRPHLKRAGIGGMLSPQELVQVASTIKTSRQIKRFVEELTETTDIDVVILPDIVEEIIVLADLQSAIDRAIDEHGGILDGASEQLRLLRNQMRTFEARIRDRLETIIRSSTAQKHLSEAIVTIRNDRFVIPVKQEYRNYYGGVIHDQSASGQTLFIEPQQIVQLNNELQHLRVKEELEIERILIQLSVVVSEQEAPLNAIVAILAQLDFMFTKAKLSLAMKASKPTMNQEGKIELYHARHPLIRTEEVVANDIFLGTSFTTMVITGPNTGGKTVTLKTVGLCTLMAQAGLQIPALDGSICAVFDAVYADIGDEQSIEQSLSTFSSHMVNIVDILNRVNHNSLVLFDELGAGTDPQEGTALAISILDRVYQCGARVIATTHYPELKAYGYNREGVINASVEFDVETLSPTYKLLIGVPGRSNAFEIAKRLGLDENIIKEAKTYVSAEDNQVEQMIASLEESKREADQQESQAQQFLRKAEALHNDLKNELNSYYEEKEQLLKTAERDAVQVVESAKVEAERIIQELRKMRLEKQADVKEHELIDAKKRLQEAAPTVPSSVRPKRKKGKQQSFKQGDEVQVLTVGQKGFLNEKVAEDEWEVQIGIIKMKVKERDMEWIATSPKVEVKPLATVKGKDYHVGLELDLRGERYEDALLRVEKYIDDALLAGYQQVSIIHGKGTGALRQGVQSYLKTHRAVKRFRFGEAGEGGFGVTVVQLK